VGILRTRGLLYSPWQPLGIPFIRGSIFRGKFRMYLASTQPITSSAYILASCEYTCFFGVLFLQCFLAGAFSEEKVAHILRVKSYQHRQQIYLFRGWGLDTHFPIVSFVSTSNDVLFASIVLYLREILKDFGKKLSASSANIFVQGLGSKYSFFVYSVLYLREILKDFGSNKTLPLKFMKTICHVYLISENPVRRKFSRHIDIRR